MQACEVKDLIIEKGKKPSHKKRKRKQVYCQNIDTDVRAPEDTNPKDEENLRKFTKRICHLKHTPVILPLFKKLYGSPEKDTITGEPGHSNHNRPKTGIMRAKLLEILTNDPKTSTEEIVKVLSFSDSERKQVERTTTKQWQCEEWYLHKTGFITASKCKREREPQNAREWGLLHEESARKAYQRVAGHNHHKLKLIPKGFLISRSKPFLGASVDNIQKCQCSDGCPVRVVEYKCPWKHRDLHPKQAFLTPEIGGIQNGNKFALKSTSNYYFQVQLQMFVSGLTLCIFVVWTNKGIFTVDVPYDPSFMSVVCAKLEKFWTSQVLPFLITDQYINSSAQQPCSHSEADVMTTSQDKSPAAATTGTSQSPLYIDLSQCSTPTPPTESVEISGLQIYKDDVETIQPKAMITDTIVLFLFK
ncbi:unnamed protein product [Porites lobata]|uniref:YqaJ viral recombinase domain-containing protein n=1 Tax=Porites lobata TaxID=104759 RepID=A0ABN8QB24_9CNID|nr:unnamed protein product [Porites lobata]